jgi:hypothetical protein
MHDISSSWRLEHINGSCEKRLTGLSSSRRVFDQAIDRLEPVVIERAWRADVRTIRR